MFSQLLNNHRILKRLAKGSDQTVRMHRLIWCFAGRTYHIVGNLMHWLNYNTHAVDCKPCWQKSITGVKSKELSIGHWGRRMFCKKVTKATKINQNWQEIIEYPGEQSYQWPRSFKNWAQQVIEVRLIRARVSAQLSRLEFKQRAAKKRVVVRLVNKKKRRGLS